MKVSLLISILFILNTGLGQDSVFTDRTAYIEYIFGELPESITPTGFLIDKNALIEDKWEKFRLNSTNRIEAELGINDWFELYQYLGFAKVQDENLPNLNDVMWPFYTDLLQQLEDIDVVELPLFVLDYNVNLFSESAIENGNIIFEDNHYSAGFNPSAGIDERHLFFAGILADTIKNSSIAVKLDENFIFSNRNKQIDFVKINFNGVEVTLYMNESFNLENDMLNQNSMLIELHYTDGEVIRSQFSFNYISPNKSTVNENDLFDEVHTIGNDPKLTYGIKFGCTNTDIRKPVIFVAGVGPSSLNAIVTLAIQNDCAELYDKFNLDDMMYELLESGHDIIIVRFTPAVDDLTESANRLIELINSINDRKTNNNSNIENMIIGYSSGAAVVRYALDKMEYEHMENNGPHPHTKLYVSFDGPQQGLNVPLSTQFMLDYMYDNHGSLKTNTVYFMANYFTAKQLFTYYWPYTGKQENGTVNNQGQAPDPLRGEFMDDMLLTYKHNKQFEKYGYYGYPAFTRNVAVANGARKTGSFSGTTVVNAPYSFNYGHTLFKQTNINKSWLMKLYASSIEEGLPTGPRTVFQYKEFNIWGSLQYSETWRTDPNVFLYDNGPGGFLTGDEDIIFLVMDKVYNSCIDGCLPGSPDPGGDEDQYRTTSFVPLVSSLDIRNFTSADRQMHYDLQEQSLMFIGFNNLGQLIESDYFGYPVLGHPTNHYAFTPFQAIYADEFNQTHVGTLIPTNTGVPSSFNNTAHPFINDFLFKEFQYKRIFLQNQNVGWNTNGTLYTAEYEAQEEIIIGEEVTPQTNIAPYIILNNGNIICHAGENIQLKNGFHATAGSGFHAYIDPLVCFYTGGGPSAMQIADEGFGNIKYISENDYLTTNEIDSKSLDFQLIPNPNNGQFIITVNNYNEPIYIQVFDLSGKIQFEGFTQNNQLLNLNLASGVYLVQLTIANQQKQQKLVVQ